MDTIKHEFIGYIRPYYDRPDIRIPVQWYFTAPGAKYIPYVTAFANVWPSDPLFVPHVGMEWSFNPNRVGNRNGYLGTKPCGDADAWLNGVSYNNPPPPCNCECGSMPPRQEIPDGPVNGTNRTFQLSEVPGSVESLILFVDGVAQNNPDDYTLTDNIIFYKSGSQPRTGDSHLAYYAVCGCAGSNLSNVQEIPSGAIDGTNTVFTLSRVPYSAASVLLLIDGVAQTQLVDYTIAGDTITFAGPSTPKAGDTLLAYYMVIA